MFCITQWYALCCSVLPFSKCDCFILFGVIRITVWCVIMFYVLDMFPYPSGSGLHVGHPLGYIASDIFARYKKLKGFNVLHPMGYDSFGLPTEQYAIQTGIHPEQATEINTKRSC